jgi:pyroglutamyl-peptidase
MRSTSHARHPAAPLRLLLTGFGPFPGIPINASARLAQTLARRLERRSNGPAVTLAVLPTEWRTGPIEAERLLRAADPDVALHFGVASALDRFRIERQADNAAREQADACGALPRAASLSARGPAALASTFPADAIEQRLAALGLPVEQSTDAGRYLCNATLYRSLDVSRRARRRRLTGFVHIPAALGDPGAASSLQGLDWNGAVRGGLAIIDTCLEHARRDLAAIA